MTRTVQRSSLGRRRKGDLHSPKGEAKMHSAKLELTRSSPLHPGDLDSSAAPSKGPKSLGSADLDLAREWLTSELLLRGVQKPVVFRARKGHGVEVKDGKRKLGQLDNTELLTHDTSAIDGVFRIRGCLKVELNPADAAESSWLLFGLPRAVVAGQGAAGLWLFRVRGCRGGGQHSGARQVCFVAPSEPSRPVPAMVHIYLDANQGFPLSALVAGGGTASGPGPPGGC